METISKFKCIDTNIPLHHQDKLTEGAIYDVVLSGVNLDNKILLPSGFWCFITKMSIDKYFVPVPSEPAKVVREANEPKTPRRRIVYICGPITGRPNNNKEAFALASEKWRKIGYEVINPHELCEDIVSQHDGTAEELWQACMKRDISWMVGCDIVVLLKGWNESRGATMERTIAQQLGIQCVIDASVITA